MLKSIEDEIDSFDFIVLGEEMLDPKILLQSFEGTEAVVIDPEYL